MWQKKPALGENIMAKSAGMAIRSERGIGHQRNLAKSIA